jgi:hypothetical protein
MSPSTSSNTNAPVDLGALYGQTPTPTETPSLIEESMRSFREMLEMDKDENSNWRLAEERCPNECRAEFKLIFLRCEIFRVELAVKRYIRYWDNRLEVFGPDKAFLPILDLGPNGAMKDNRKELEHGYTRYAPPGECQDPDGRAICFMDGRKLEAARNDPDITQEGMIRASWYQSHVGLLSESAQRKGCVVIYRAVKSVKDIIKSPSKAMVTSLRGALPLRLAAVHIIDPPVVVSVLLKMARHILGNTLQNRLYLHNRGSREKNLESLSKYGLGRTQLPKEMGGDFVFEDLKLV